MELSRTSSSFSKRHTPPGHIPSSAHLHKSKSDVKELGACRTIQLKTPSLSSRPKFHLNMPKSSGFAVKTRPLSRRSRSDLSLKACKGSCVKTDRALPKDFDAEFKQLFSNNRFIIYSDHPEKFIRPRPEQPYYTRKLGRESVVTAKTKSSPVLEISASRMNLNKILTECTKLGKTTERDRENIQKALNTNRISIKEKLTYAPKFSNNYMKKCVEQFKNENIAFLYGKNFKGKYVRQVNPT